MTEPDSAELESGRMPFFEHLRELRDRVRNAAIAFVIGVVACWWFAERIYVWLRVPIDHAWLKYPALGKVPTMIFGSVVEPFWVYISVALWAGIFLSSPFVFHQIWQFIAPGLYKRERRFGVSFAVCSALLFVAGALFCYYFALEPVYTYLLSYATTSTEKGAGQLVPMLMMRDYFDLTRNMMLAFGAIFELPLLIYFLALAGLVTPRGLWKFNRWFVVIAFVLGAILSPGPDVVSQLMMAMPMIVLYNLSILGAFLVQRKRDTAATASAPPTR